jgi:hypothetical protein
VLLGDFDGQGEEAFLEKLDPQLTRVLEEGVSSATSAEPLVVLIQFLESPSPDVLSRLQEIGIEIQSVAGDVATARLPTLSLGRLSQFDEVVYVESSERLFSE